MNNNKDKCKNSIDMEDEIFDIVTDLIRDDISKEQAIDKLLILHNVSDCQLETYARFCIECDRKGLKPIKYNDYLKIG